MPTDRRQIMHLEDRERTTMCSRPMDGLTWMARGDWEREGLQSELAAPAQRNRRYCDPCKRGVRRDLASGLVRV